MNPNGHRLHWCWLVTRPSYRSVPMFVDKLYSCQVHVQILITIFLGGAFVALQSTCEFNTTKELGTEKTDKKNHYQIWFLWQFNLEGWWWLKMFGIWLIISFVTIITMMDEEWIPACLLGQPVRRKARPQGNSSIIVSWWRANLIRCCLEIGFRLVATLQDQGNFINYI